MIIATSFRQTPAKTASAPEENMKGTTSRSRTKRRRLDPLIKKLFESLRADMNVRSGEVTMHAMKANNTHRTPNKAAQSIRAKMVMADEF